MTQKFMGRDKTTMMSLWVRTTILYVFMIFGNENGDLCPSIIFTTGAVHCLCLSIYSLKPNPLAKLCLQVIPTLQATTCFTKDDDDAERRKEPSAAKDRNYLVWKWP